MRRKMRAARIRRAAHKVKSLAGAVRAVRAGRDGMAQEVPLVKGDARLNPAVDDDELAGAEKRAG